MMNKPIADIDDLGVYVRYYDYKNHLTKTNEQSYSCVKKHLELSREKAKNSSSSLYIFNKKQHDFLKISLEKDLNPSLTSLQVDLENGQQTVLQSQGSIECQFDCHKLPDGYHHYRLLDDTKQILQSGMLIVSPGICYQPKNLTHRKGWGFSIQLYTLRGENDWGVGDFSLLKEFVTHAAKQGADFVGINPTHELFPNAPESFSPYSPSNRWFLNILYIDVTRIQGYEEALKQIGQDEDNDLLTKIKNLRERNWVDYSEVFALKLTFLEKLYVEFKSKNKSAVDVQQFNNFINKNEKLLSTAATFNALHEKFAKELNNNWGWPAWPENYRNPKYLDANVLAELKARIEFYQFAQWIAHEQLSAVVETTKEFNMLLGLYGDLAVGANVGGAETWLYQDAFANTVTVGAPADANVLNGQNWGFPPFDPEALKAQNYQAFINILRQNMQYCGALRIDHVMALQRLWWVPENASAKDGVFVSYPVDELIAVLALESQRNECLIIGEDLGVVPQEFRATMETANIFSYRVGLFETDDNGQLTSPDDWISKALAILTTHDLPTLKGFFNAWDLNYKKENQLFLSESDEIQSFNERHVAIQMLCKTLNINLHNEHEFQKLTLLLHEYLASTQSLIMAINPEDVIGEEKSVNIPGTFQEYQNWQRKLHLTVNEIFDTPLMTELIEKVKHYRA
ncbi:MAG: 4-alpha-glucanotransferase [Pseudomonadota bacterium]